MISAEKLSFLVRAGLWAWPSLMVRSTIAAPIWLPPRDSNPDMLLQRQLSYLPPSFQRRLRLSRVFLSFQYVKQKHTLRSTRVASPENTGKPGTKLQNVTPKVTPLAGRFSIEQRHRATLTRSMSSTFSKLQLPPHFWFIGFWHRRRSRPLLVHTLRRDISNTEHARYAHIKLGLGTLIWSRRSST
jgi:hypothetical protein